MKVLVIKTESVIPRKILLEAQKEIEKCASSGILLLDGGYTYEVVEIDVVKVEEPKEIDGYDFDNTSITFKSIKDAKDARDYLALMTRINGCVTIATFEKYVHHPTGRRDNLYGWRKLKEEDVKIVHIYKYDTMSCCYFDQFYLELPKPKRLCEED